MARQPLSQVFRISFFHASSGVLTTMSTDRSADVYRRLSIRTVFILEIFAAFVPVTLYTRVLPSALEEDILIRHISDTR